MPRYMSLDALRGLTIALMILVNTPGSWSFVFPPLLHADWHGMTPTDLVFPFFLFIIGSALFFSLKKSDELSSSEKYFKIIKRGVIIFAIGLALNAFPFNDPIDQLRILGVLQRIALAYVFAAVLVSILNQRQIYIVSAVLLLGYWLILLSVGSEHAYSLEQNIVRHWDLLLLGENHLWGGKGIPFDPEGLLSTIPSIVSMLIGFEVTRYLTSIEDKKESVNKLIIIGVIGLVIGYTWHLIMPINKSLWTSSFVLASSGMACLVLSAFVYIVDVKGHKKLVEPLLVYGTNPLFVYVLSSVWVTCYQFISIGNEPFGRWLYIQLSTVFPPTLASFVYALSHVILFWFISQQLYKRKIFIKI